MSTTDTTPRVEIRRNYKGISVCPEHGNLYRATKHFRYDVLVDGEPVAIALSTLRAAKAIAAPMAARRGVTFTIVR